MEARTATLEVCYRRALRGGKESVMREMVTRAAWVCASGVSFNAAAGPEFDQWVAALRKVPSTETLLSTRTVENNILPVLDDILSEKIMESLRRACVVVCCFDGWESMDGSYWLAVCFTRVGGRWQLHSTITNFIRLLARSANSQSLELGRVFNDTLAPQQIVGLAVTDCCGP